MAQNESRGQSIPTFCYGTAWKEDNTERLTSQAISSGFRAIDTANQRKHYFEEGVGRAIKCSIDAGLVSRAEMFLQTKYTFIHGQDQRLPYDPSAAIAAQVEQSFEKSLQHLQTDYLDSYLLHGPQFAQGLSDEDWEAWGVIESLKQSGRVKHIGVSNFSAEQLRALLSKTKEKPTFVQNRCYASKAWDRDVREICNAHSLVYQGFSLLTANSNFLGDARMIEICERHKKQPSQIVFRFAQQIGMLPLTGTTSEAHMKEDLDIADLNLSKDELDGIETIAV